MYEEKLNRYKNIIIFLIAVICLSIYIIWAEWPDKNTADMTVVAAKVVSVSNQYVVPGKPESGMRYYLVVEVDNTRYDIGPLANAAFREGITYDMYKYKDRIYTNIKTAQNAADDEKATITFRIAAGTALVSIIVIIGIIAAYIQTNKKQLQDR